ncbi:XAP5 protein [Trichuris trichiura]|uniref:Protein FAM50 homolog n=1 Tax=Trichuris trichiura TaxID=36087 RepID=A0A077YXX6_TRITR|nr:XAP5 protein [Trichuris trichiura]
MAHYTGSIADAGRLIHIAKRRERHKEDIEKQRQKIQAEKAALVDIGEKFKTHFDMVEHRLKSTTIGLVTLDEMKAKQELAIQERDRLLATKEREQRLKCEEEDLEKKRTQETLQRKSTLSFNMSDEDETEASVDVVPVKKKCYKDPTVDTSFLPDRERELEENRLREQLCKEWTEQQEKIKNESINIAFSYWDGSGHRRDLKMKKGSSIQQFLQRALEVLRRDFNELKTMSTDSLMFVKEDLIIPHFYTFYDFIVTKTMGKTGPLFEFDAAGELRIRQDALVDTSESHPAKVVLRQWYERNKHIYPASRWEPFDPNKKYDRTVEDLREL